MSAKIRRNIFSYLIEVIKKNQITAINASVTVILIAIVIFVMEKFRFRRLAILILLVEVDKTYDITGKKASL